MTAARTDDAILQELASLVQELVALRQPAPAADAPCAATDADWPRLGVPDALALKVAKDLVRLRSDRFGHFRADLFGEPAWDMLLELFIARLEGRVLSASTLCIAARVPSVSALRYIDNLERHGEVVCRPDPDDPRRKLVALSDTAVLAMRASLVSPRYGLH